jgi:hypothetical protein
MKKKLLGLAFLAACLIICFEACKKEKAKPVDGPAGGNNKPDPKPDTAAYVKFEHGTPVGQGVTKNIGAEGGTIAMPDGKISIQIPAGALGSATEIKIQPVTNTLPMGSSDFTYKLTPENIHFSKPVSIKFKYDAADLEGTIHDGMYVAFQDAAGHWFGKVNTALDSVNKTLTVKTKHFSTWGKYRLFRMMSDLNSMQEGEKNRLYIMVMETEAPIVDEGEADIIAPIVEAKDYNTKKNFSGWKIKGKGTIKPKNENAEAEYTAPASITQKSTVTAEVTISNLFDKHEPDRPGKSGKMILLKSIELVPSKFDLYVDGKKISLTNISANSNGLQPISFFRNFETELYTGKTIFYFTQAFWRAGEQDILTPT